MKGRPRNWQAIPGNAARSFNREIRSSISKKTSRARREMGKSLPLQPLPVALWCTASKMLPMILLPGIHAHVLSFPPRVREWPGPSDVLHNSMVNRQAVPSEIGSPKDPGFHLAGPVLLSYLLPLIQTKLWANSGEAHMVRNGRRPLANS